MSGLNFLPLIIEARLGNSDITLLCNNELLEFEQHFECELRSAVSVWEKRESTFAFLENKQTPECIEKALILKSLLRHSDEVIYEIENLLKDRETEDKTPMASELLLTARSLEELIFIETLSDEKLTCQVARFVNKTEQKLIKDTMSIIHRYLEQFCLAYQEQVEQLEVKNDQESWLAYPCMSCRINKWSQHFDSKTFDFMNVSHPLIDVLLDQIYNEWSVLWQTQNWAQQIDYQCEDSVEETDIQVWRELFEPFILEIATESIRALRDEDFIEDLNSCFTTLIDAKRPKDQRIGSLWIDEASPENITVMFLTRDGKLLAQRDLTWDLNQVDSIIEAFSIINIRILTYPEGLDQIYPKAFNLLKNRYQLFPVSSVVLDPVPHPLSLTDNAQKALRIGQRFVAPLRFWARTDLIELMKCFTTPRIIDCLEESNRLDRLQARLQDSCAERWLLLRQRRQNRKIKKPPNHSAKALSGQASSNTDDSSLSVGTESHHPLNTLQVGDLVEAQILSIDDHHAESQIIHVNVNAHLKLNKNHKLEVGHLVQTVVLAIDSKTNHVKLGLKRNSDTLRKGHKHSQERPEQDTNKSTLNRLNKLFASN
ncbi:MAG: hypothetical protein CMH49_10390 [Myxococcales bacterium]|nr:hypothetical protein [Myxococcales bacterium]